MIQRAATLRDPDTIWECTDGYWHGMSDVTTLLKTVREAQRLSQDALAEKLGVTQATVSRYEAGGISLGKIQDWADALGHELTAVPSDRAALVTTVSIVAAGLDQAELERLTQIVANFATAPSWARMTAAEVLEKSSTKVVAKGA